MNDNDRPSPRVTRRGVLGAAGAALLGASAGVAFAGTSRPAAAAPLLPAPAEAPQPAVNPGSLTYPFYGTHQSGVETPMATLQTFIGLNLRSADKDTAEAILRLVSDTAARLTQGVPALGDMEPEVAAVPAGLTVTVGLGRAFFTAAGVQHPPQLRDIPQFTTDRLQRRWGQTDLLLQIGSNDALALSHAVRVLLKDVSQLAEVAWAQDGFQSPVPSNPGSHAGRNLMGQVDGTVNPRPGSAEFTETVWISDGAPWVAGGTVLVLRRIKLLMAEWDLLDPVAQDRAIGRHRGSGAPLGGTHENEPMPWDAVDKDGFPVIPLDAHARVAHAKTTAESIFRRPYNYDAGIVNGEPELGLLFAAYMRDPKTSFIPMQKRLADHDAFNVWNTTIGSSTYFILPGATDGTFLGEAMFR